MSTTEFQAALDHHRAGRLREAESAYRKLLEQNPNDIDALNGLGVLAVHARRLDEAVDFFSRAVARRPTSMAFQCNLGMAHQSLRQYAPAEAAYRRAIELVPTEASPHFNLANALKEQKKLEEAAAHYLKAIERRPDDAVMHNNLGNCYREQGRLEEARRSLARAIQLRPQYAEAWSNLGNVWIVEGQPVQAEICCREAVRLQPTLAAGYMNLGTALTAQAKNREAAEALRRATEVAPAMAEAHEHFGWALLDVARLTDAVAAIRRAVEAEPNRAEAWNRLGAVLTMHRQFVDGDACYQRALDLEPDNSTIHSNWLWWRFYRPDATLRSLAASHADWDARHGSPPKVQPAHRAAQGTPSTDRPLRLGFVGADFGQHPVGSFTIRTLEALPALGFEIACYSTHPRVDAQNVRFRKLAALWREVQSMPDNALAARITADQIDILIDLAGHSGGNRLGVFARRPAPVQATWIGNEGTTGLSTMDYLIADHHVVPVEAERFYRERVVRLPVCYVSWEPPAAAGPVAPSPSTAGRPVTFGSFNNPAKYHADLAELWSRVLHRVPGSRLLLQYRHLTDPTLRRELMGLFAAHGIDGARLELRDWQPYAELLKSYGEVDVALDPFPFGGGVTTCEALWMGVPVVTWPGETFASRHSCSYLSTAGLDELIAPSADAYVDVAVGLAQDPTRLRELRDRLRERLESSPLTDGQCCAVALAKLLQAMWSGRGSK